MLRRTSRSRGRVPLLDGLGTRDLVDMLRHVTERAGNPALLTTEVMNTLAEHSAGLPRVLMQMADDLLLAGAARDRERLDEKLYLEVFAQPRDTRTRSRTQARP